MSVSRREFLQQAMVAFLLQHGAAFRAMLGSSQQNDQLGRERDFASFGVSADGQMLDPRSFYRVPAVATAHDRLCFDVSNNRIACSIDQRGLLERFAIQIGVAPVETKGSPVGAYVEKVLYRTGPIPLWVTIGDSKRVAIHELGQPEIHLEDGLFPRFQWSIGPVRLTMLAFAPQTAKSRPRAICTQWMASSPGSDHPAVSIHTNEILTLGQGSNIPAECCALLADAGQGWTAAGNPADASIPITNDAGATLAFLIDATTEELQGTHREIAASPATAWLSRTRDYHLGRYGELRISEAPFYAELYVRAAELTRQSLMLDGHGEFGGSFNGSDLPPSLNVWMRDCFYSSLPQTFLSPEISRVAIEFLLHWGIPSHPLGEHADRFPGAPGVTNSLGNSVAGIVLAGMHYRRNNDRQFFLDHPEILQRSIAILDQVLSSRREEVFLFPSIYVSDGESRGDFHTGSNIFLWRAFSDVARLAEEVYGQPEVAAQWSLCANRLHEAILANCIVLEGGGPRFVEGSMQDHSKIGGHDGEESDVTLAAVYEFCDPDDHAYLNAAREATTPANPYAIAEVQGIWWYAHSKWSSATFPGWMTALAGSRDEAELLVHLERIRTLTDADGSFWWWPYPHDAEVHQAHPQRTNSKCGWAAGVYLSLFTGQILGLSVDAPRRSLTFRPWMPWRELTWIGCRLGGIEIDCSYQRSDSDISIEVRNRTDRALLVNLQALLPEKAKMLGASVSRAPKAEISQSKLYGRIVSGCAIEVHPNDRAVLRVQFSGV